MPALPTKKSKTKKSKTKKPSSSLLSLPSEDAVSDENIDVDFAFFEPYETDFHGVRALSAQAFNFCRKKPVLDVGELANCACEQGNIGTVLKTGSTEESVTEEESGSVLAICTLLNLRQYGLKVHGGEFLESSVDMLADWLDGEAVGLLASETGPNLMNFSSVKDLIAKKNVGFFMNQRIVGLPVEDVVPALQSALIEGVKWSQTAEECPKNEKPFYFFDYVLGISAIEESESEISKFEFLNVEERAYADRAETKTILKVGGGDVEEEMRMIWIMPGSKLEEATKKASEIAKE